MAQNGLTGIDEMLAQMNVYEQRVHAAVQGVADYFAPILEAYAKSNAPWTDQTGNARQSLHTYVEELAAFTVELFLAHGMPYGVHLETQYSGRYAIIWETIEVHLPRVWRMVEDIFR